MCGIAGFVDPSSKYNGSDVLRTMAHQLAHRGPDDTGIWLDGDLGIGLSHTRLSIVDLSAGGHQPKESSTGRFIIIFNGEIYNHRQLRQACKEKNHKFNSTSDTEVLLSCIELWGLEKALDMLIGMFAFVLFDKVEKTLRLVRDRLGEKPLYYGWQRRVFLFGSELKAMRCHPAWEGELNRKALANYMSYGYVPGDECIHLGINKLLPGNILTLDLKKKHLEPKLSTWWSVAHILGNSKVPLFSGTLVDAEIEIQALARTILDDQIYADVPVGVLLSGGIDSSFVAATAQSLSSSQIQTFTIGFREQDHDESTYAKSIANALGTKHSEWFISPTEVLNVVPNLAHCYDEPFSDSSQIPTFLAYQLAGGSTKVVVTGDGGDELFGGYNRHFWAPRICGLINTLPIGPRRVFQKILLTVPTNYWEVLFNQLVRLTPKHLRIPSAAEKMQKLIKLLDCRTERDSYETLIKNHGESLVIGHEPRNIIDDQDQIWNLASSFAERMMLIDSVTYLPDDILVKVDRASMANSVESRAPFLDHRMVQLALSLPMDFKVSHGAGKKVIKRSLARILAPELTNRPKKGFSIPIGDWLRGPLRSLAEDLLSPQLLARQGYFDSERIRTIWKEHIDQKRNNQAVLWQLVVFQSWLQENNVD